MKKLILGAAALVAVLSAAVLGAVLGATPASADVAPFGCDAARGNLCHVRLFYAGGRGRMVILPAGTRQGIPDLKIGTDHYCVGVNRSPPYRCTRKTVNANYNN